MNAVESQRRAALLLANEVRCAKARMKAEVRAGDLALSAAWHEPCASSMPIGDLLLCVPRVGRSKADRVLRKCGVSWGRPVGSLTVRERACLVSGLADVGVVA